MAKAIITIGRQYGSGGREIGQRLAEKLGIKCYDSELLDRAAKDSGMCQEIFENHDERPTNSFLYSLVMDTYSMGYSLLLLQICRLTTRFFWHSSMPSRRSPKKVPALWLAAVQITRWQTIRIWYLFSFMRLWKIVSVVLQQNMI